MNGLLISAECTGIYFISFHNKVFVEIIICAVTMFITFFCSSAGKQQASRWSVFTNVSRLAEKAVRVSFCKV